MIHFITFASEEFKTQNDHLFNQVDRNFEKFTSFTTYEPGFIETRYRDFYTNNIEIFRQKIGCGYWLWKPLIIHDTLKYGVSSKDDIFIYMDSGDFFITEKIPKFITFLNDYFKDNDILLTPNVNNDPQKKWTKRDCFVLMGCDNPRFWNSAHLEAGFIALKRTEANLEFINKWIYYSTDKRILTDVTNECGFPNFDEFKEHRHDQSILTNLCYKNGIKPTPLDGYIEFNAKTVMVSK